jgi:small subunit ribosomal protein S1
MSENISMNDWLDKFDTTEKLSRGDVVEGVVISVNAEEIMVNINYMADGIVPKAEIPDENPLDYTVGQKVSVFVSKIDDGDGNVLLSLSRAEGLIVWDELQVLFQEEKTFELKIKEAVKGGVVGIYKTARIFIPASQLSLAYVSDLTAYVGTKLDVKLIELIPDSKKAVASHKVIEQADAAAKRDDFLSRVSVNDRMTGTVTRLAQYGAFVDLGGVDGLIHVSQMSWRHVKHPSEIMNEGDVVDVIVINVDREAGKIGLKLATIIENPWESIYTRYAPNDIVPARITRITQFGAFAELEEGVEGLIHISELSEEHVAKVSEVVQVGEEVEVLILDLDAENQKISLSLKAVESLDEEIIDLIETDEESSTTMQDLFGDKLKNLKF